ncbi:MAG: hypothetical protein IPH12_15565 [Saprospirales bacterium]|nr:hypothetical protein [Saprospirales bacterium]
MWLNGGYDQRYDLRRLLRGLGMGTVLLAAIYGFLDLEYRPSRALLLLGAAWSALALTGLRALLHFAEFRNFRIGRERVKNLVIAGSPGESQRVLGLLNQAGVVKNVIGTVGPSRLSPGQGSVALKVHPGAQSATSLREKNTAREQIASSDPEMDHQSRIPALPGGLEEAVRIFPVDEIIFCSKDLRATEIMDWMTRLGPSIAYKIVPEGSQSIIGSSSKDEPGELYTTDTRYNIAQPGQRRNKRVLDAGLCLFLLPALPLWLAFSVKQKLLLANWWPVLRGRKSWVGYAGEVPNPELPRLKPGVFSPLEGLQDLSLPAPTVDRLNFLYAKDWSVWTDIRLINRRNARNRQPE